MTDTKPLNLVFLTGISGAGKSTIGKQLASLLERKFIDVDELIVTKENMCISDIFKTFGEAHFRKSEAEELERITANSRIEAVIALGGGALLSRATQEIITKAGRLIYLEVSCDAAAKRLLEKTDRPLTLENDKPLSLFALSLRLKKLLDSRLEGYMTANYVIEVSSRSVDDICQDISNYLSQE